MCVTDKEKLIRLLINCGVWGANKTIGEIADYLIANGVTFATDTKVGDKWIRVDDRLPENDARVLVCDTREDYVSIWEYFGDGLWFGDEVIWATEDITHWMPLPEPPDATLNQGQEL